MIHLTRPPDGYGIYTFCTAVCVQAWLDDDPEPGLPDHLTEVASGPAWCLHCHQCGARAWSHPDCVLCPGCQQPRWTITAAAATFAAELGRYATRDLPPDAYEQGERFCERGYTPVFAARLVVALHRR